MLQGITKHVKLMVNKAALLLVRVEHTITSTFSVNFLLNQNLCTVRFRGEDLITKDTRED